MYIKYIMNFPLISKINIKFQQKKLLLFIIKKVLNSFMDSQYQLYKNLCKYNVGVD